MKLIYNISFCVMVLGVGACRPEHPPPVRAFYHWKTRLAISQEERAYIDRLGVNTLYVKFYDVDWSEAYAGPVPLAEVEIDSALLQGLQIVPCIFITNRCMSQIQAGALPGLAERMLQKIDELAAQYPGMALREIQLDCDWTASTREYYFALLEYFRKSLSGRDIRLSVTVRLHQYRWPEQTGVPPADRGMLMCYNTGDLDNWEEENSILRQEEARQYLSSTEVYPLPLDVALPVFGWGVLFRNDRMIRLIHGLTSKSLADTTRFRSLAPHRFEVVKSTYLDGHYLYEGDRLRMETPAPADLEQSAGLLRKVLRRSGTGSTAALYHLDTLTVKRFPPESVEGLFRILE